MEDISNPMQPQLAANIICTTIQNLVQAPFLYNDLPEATKKDPAVARAAIRGVGKMIGVKTNDDGIVEYGFFLQNGRHTHDICRDLFRMYWIGFNFSPDEDQQHTRELLDNYTDLVKNLFEFQPEAVYKEIGLFRMSMMPILKDRRFPLYSYDAPNDFDGLLRCLNRRGVDDIIYRELATIIILEGDDRYFSGIYTDVLLESVKRDNRVACRFGFPAIWTLEHFIKAIIYHRPYGRKPLWGVRLDNIPEEFVKARIFLEHLIVHNSIYSLPPELVADREFCLAFLLVDHQMKNRHHEHDRFWNSIPERVRNDEEFFLEAVFRNLAVFHRHCKSSTAPWQQQMKDIRVFKVILAAIKGHGYSKTVDCTRVSNRIDLIDSFDTRMKNELDHHDQFMVFLGGIVQSRRSENCNCAVLRMIDFGDEATSTSLKRHIASYVNNSVPIKDLREVWALRSQYQRGLDLLFGENDTVTD